MVILDLYSYLAMTINFSRVVPRCRQLPPKATTHPPSPPLTTTPGFLSLLFLLGLFGQDKPQKTQRLKDSKDGKRPEDLKHSSDEFVKKDSKTNKLRDLKAQKT